MPQSSAVWSRYGGAATVAVGIHLLWYLLTNVIGISPIFLPTPFGTYKTLLDLILTQQFWSDAAASWFRAMVAFTLSFAFAYPLVLAALISQSVRSGIFLIVEFFRYLPVPAFIPLAILWFGVGDLAKVVVVFLGVCRTCFGKR